MARSSRWRAVALVSLPVALAAQPAWPPLGLTIVVQGFALPVHATHADDGSGRLFIMEQEGRIRIVGGGGTLATPFLEIAGRTTCCGEAGLLSVAFPPDYDSKAYFYVY